MPCYHRTSVRASGGMADAQDSGSCGGNPVEVQVLSRPQEKAEVEFLLAQPHRAVVRPSFSRRIRRGTFNSVAKLVRSIEAYIGVHNTRPKPLGWHACADLILG
jgi:hypothetical protein